MGRCLSYSCLYFPATVFLCSCLASAASAQTTYTITDLGTLGGSTSIGFGINSSGQITGSSATAGDTTRHAFLYSGGTMKDLGTLGGNLSEGAGINDAGQVTGDSDITGDQGSHAFLYSGGTMTDLGVLPGGNYSFGSAINASGQVTGGSDVGVVGGDRRQHAVLYSGGTMTDLEGLGGDISFGSGINASGEICGTSLVPGDIYFEGFLTGPSGFFDLGALGGRGSFANGINASGQVTGNAATVSSGDHAFLYSAGVMTDLGTLNGGINSVGVGINDSGQIVGLSMVGTTFPFVFHSFLYGPDTGMVDLNNLIQSGSGWTQIEAIAINNAGQITGYGVNPNGLQHAFLLSPAVVPFSAFDARLEFTGRPASKFRLRGNFALGTGTTGIDPITQTVTLQLGTFSVSVPKGSFTQTSKGDYEFQGLVGTVALLFRITEVTNTSFNWQVNGAANAGLPTTSPVIVGLTIGNNTGAVNVIAHGQGK